MFEIITVGGERFRYERIDLNWQFASKKSSPDKLDKKVVEVINMEDDSIVKTFTQVIAVGDVEEDTTLMMPYEIRPIAEQCPCCGYRKYYKEGEPCYK